MKKTARFVTPFLILSFLLALILPGGISPAHAMVLTSASPDTLTGKTSTEIVAMMNLGYNIGNTFDSTGGTLEKHETMWGNPKVTQEFVDAVYDAGFNTIRIPITWMDFISKDGTYTINPDYLARVKEVVDYCYNDGFFVIINAHHESWINRKDLDTAYPEVAVELNALWTQIATYFADYDQHLIFEGMNEPRMVGTSTEWSGSDEGYAAVNYLNQVFVNAVRSTGLGHNDERCLMIPGYAAASSTTALQSIAIPTYDGKPVNNLIVSVHSYTPYEFCLTDQSNTFLIGISTGSIDAVFRDINRIFIQNGIPVIIGETGSTNSGNNTEARATWSKYTAQKAVSYGIPIILWDNGANKTVGGECHSYINRRTGQVLFPEIFDAMKEGFGSMTRGSAVGTLADPMAGEPDPDASFSYRVNGLYYASSADGKPANPSVSGMKFLGWYLTPDFKEGTEFTGVVPKGVKTVYAKMALSSYRKVATSLTPAELPVIEPRDTRPLPTATPTPTPEFTEAVTPSAAPTETPVTETPTPTPTPEDGAYNPVVIYMMLAVSLLMISAGVFLVLRGIMRRRKM